MRSLLRFFTSGILILGFLAPGASWTADSMPISANTALEQINERYFGRDVLIASLFAHGIYDHGVTSVTGLLALLPMMVPGHQEAMREAYLEYVGKAKAELYRLLLQGRAGLNPLTMDDLITIDDASATFSVVGVGGATDPVHLKAQTVQLKLTQVGKLHLALGVSPNATIEESVYALGMALKSLKLLPSQKKMLRSFFDASKRFHDSLLAEKEKLARREKVRLVTHRDFQDQAALLIAYHGYLTDVLGEAAELQSETYGKDRENSQAVEAIRVAIQNLADAYGLDGDSNTHKVADYGRVLVDLLINQLYPLVEEKQKQRLLKPILVTAGEAIARSQGQGDMTARQEVIAFKEAWIAPEFTQFLIDRLSTTDSRMNSLILNLNSLAYRIGTAVDISVPVLDQQQLDLLKRKRK